MDGSDAMMDEEISAEALGDIKYHRVYLPC